MKRSPFLVAYDISDPRRRLAARRAVTGWSHSGQKSVYECWATPSELPVLKADMLRAIDPSEDRLAIFALPPAGPFIALGRGRTPSADPLLYVG